MKAQEIYLVRHGAYDFSTGRLNSKGVEQARETTRELLSFGIGSSAVILCSSAPRAVHTSEIIAECTGSKVAPSDVLQYAALDPRGVEDFDDFIDKVLLKAQVECNEQLVVVAHEPLLQAAAYGSTKGAPHFDNGAIYRYQPGTWHNENLNHTEAAIIQALL